jgi:tetratricopeptide (TPR) repeat protein
VRTLVTLFIIFFMGLLAGVCASAEVIHLKNGRTIWADHVREDGLRVEYDLGDNSYAIPKSSVARVEVGGVPPEYVSAGASTKHDVPAFVPPDNVRNEAEISNRVIKDGKIDIDVLSAIEQQGNSKDSAVGYFVAGKFEFDHGNFAKARSYFDAAIRFDGQNPTILNFYAALLVRTGNAAEALPYAQRAVQVAPDSADTLAVLGYAQFAADRTKDAIQSWKRSLQIRPDPVIRGLLEKAEREAQAEAEFSERESNHFTLRYEGTQTSEAFRRQLLGTLESEYEDLERELGGAPRGNIPVIIYTGQSFFDVTQAPSWSGAVNDGKLRIPVSGLTTVTPELARVLKHELAHSFINQLSAGRCPQWLHEGIAQALEPKSLSSNGRRLAQLYAAQKEIPFNMLESSFMRFAPVEAVLAYDESLAAVQYIDDTRGRADLKRILQRLAEGSSTEAALRSTIHSDYGQLETELGKYLVDKYGN